MANPNSKKGKAKFLSKTNDRYAKKLQESECGTRQLVWILQCHAKKCGMIVVDQKKLVKHNKQIQ